MSVKYPWYLSLKKDGKSSLSLRACLTIDSCRFSIRKEKMNTNKKKRDNSYFLSMNASDLFGCFFFVLMLVILLKDNCKNFWYQSLGDKTKCSTTDSEEIGPGKNKAGGLPIT
jgi:hypothetical protein